MSKNKKIGKKASDSITGFNGTVTAFAQYITGCDQYLVTPECKEEETGTIPESHWFDENRLSFSKKIVKEIKTDKMQGAMDSAPRK